jgi:hypothetical protein
MIIVGLRDIIEIVKPDNLLKKKLFGQNKTTKMFLLKFG